MAKSSRLKGDSRQRRKLSKSDSSEGSNSDEKKESDGGSSSSRYGDPSNWQEIHLGEKDTDAGKRIEHNRHRIPPCERPPGAASDYIMQPHSFPAGFSAQEDVSRKGRLQVDRTDTEEIRRSGSISNGLHHRHHFGPSTISGCGSFGGQFPLNQTSPTRRRRSRPALPKGPAEHQSRKRKWTVLQVFRFLLLGGASVYFFVMLRGTQILMQQNTNNDDNQEPSRGRLSDYLPVGLPAGYASHPAIQGYLRAGSMTIESLAPFIHKAINDSPGEVQRAIRQRLLDRQKRTRPPDQQPFAKSIASHEIVSAEKQARPILQTESSSRLADDTKLCGKQARKAKQQHPESFLEQDALVNSRAKVLITGIVSNPMAFHLALALLMECGVEVLVGIDPMLPNTIRNRMQHIEQMQILAANAPRMVQPILVPVLGLDPRVKRSKKDTPSEQLVMLELTDELNLANFEPTHIVHLSSAAYQNPVSTTVPQSPMAPKRPMSPYQISVGDSYEPSLFQIRSSMMSMEQVLASLVDNIEDNGNTPHLTFAASSTGYPQSHASNDDIVLAYTKQMDEVLADTYQSLFGVSSVAIRFPPNAIYGPWDTQSKLHRMMIEAINGNFTAFDKGTDVLELIFVQDAVEAVISAMQYRDSEHQATNFDLVGSPPVPLSTVASVVESVLSATSSSARPVDEAQPKFIRQNQRILERLHWAPKTSIRDGILKTLAWTLDRVRPYGAPGRGQTTRPSLGSPTKGTGDALLLANSVPTCASDDLACHSGPAYLPCTSECSIKAQCQESIFDSVIQLSREMTEGCDAVLYTQSLGLYVEDMQLQSQFEDDVEPAICNLAFVAQTSPLVNAVIGKIPKEELQRLGVPATSRFDEKLKRLNGRLLYRGWILIWVDPVDPVSLADSSLLKLSPGRMFADDVLYAVFVEENFTVSPTTDDVRFLISQMDRGATKQRNIYRMVKTDEHSKPKKVKYTISAQPEKRSSILVSQLKFKISERGRIPQETKISVMDAVRFMRFEIGSDPTKQRESSAIKRQKDFYRRIPSFLNGKDLRDNFEPIYKYELKHWVRTRWVVHDLTLEESRELRCDWYQEHVQWGTEIDQLSFAAVMARRIIDRRMTLLEADDRSKPKPSGINELKDVTDHDEWFSMATKQNKLHVLQSTHLPGVQEMVGDDTKDEADEEDGLDPAPSEPRYSPEKRPEVGLYVRIISDRIMSLSRKAWSRYRAEIQQAAAAAENP